MFSFRTRAFLFFAIACLHSTAFATADGPDFYRVQDLPEGATLELRAEPRANAAVIDRLSPDAQCLRNLGCQGGLSFEEYNTLSPEDRQRRLVANPRWCRVDHKGVAGWVDGRLLAEAPCAGTASSDARVQALGIVADARPAVIRATIKGRDYVDYRVSGGAGQLFTVSLKASNRQNYFNVLPPGRDAAMFIGSSSGQVFSRALPADGEYTVRVYLMRAAARRNETSRYALSVSLAGKPLAPIPASKDAVLPGAPYHASAVVPCRQAGDALNSECQAYVIRRSFDGTATLEIRRADGVLRRLLFVKGVPVSSDATADISVSKSGDRNIVHIGNDERFEFPDALITGG